MQKHFATRAGTHTGGLIGLGRSGLGSDSRSVSTVAGSPATCLVAGLTPATGIIAPDVTKISPTSNSEEVTKSADDESPLDVIDAIVRLSSLSLPLTPLVGARRGRSSRRD